MLDKNYSKSDTYLASKKSMSVAPQLVRVASGTEARTYLLRMGEILAVDPEVIGKVRTSCEDVRQSRILSTQEAFRQLRREEVLSPR